jgi:tripartite-type tricarboxylate transporter receptor subunit TctC
LKDQNVIKQSAELGTTPVDQSEATPDALAAKLNAEIDRWAPVIKEAGVYAD